jgi:hypothetical protein
MQRFAVAKPGGVKYLEFVSYYHMMKKWAIDEFNMPRTPDPETGRRWLHVWDKREEADRFAKELRKATKDRSWRVYEVDPPCVSQGPIGPLEIHYTCQRSGYTYYLSGYTELVLQQRFLQACQVQSVFIETDTNKDFEASQGPIWDYIAIILTGLTPKQLDQMGGYHVRDPITDESWHEVPLLPSCSTGRLKPSKSLEASQTG